MTTAARLNCLNTSLNAAAADIAALQSENTALQAHVDALEASRIPGLTEYLSVDVATDSVIFSGANVYVESGSGATDGALNGRGNLVIGYGEDGVYYGRGPSDRTGSHNLVVGGGHSYTSMGGLVAGFHNMASAEFASVCGGEDNESSGAASTVSGGFRNVASGDWSSVSGGSLQIASGEFSAVSGGRSNVASGPNSSVSGGGFSEASGAYSSVLGGADNEAIGDYSAILGGDGVSVRMNYDTSP